MSELKQMYQLLKQMVQSAEVGDKTKITQLNEAYEKLVSKVYHNPLTPLESRYDNCRHSCVMSVTMLNHMHKKLVANAKQRFARLPQP